MSRLPIDLTATASDPQQHLSVVPSATAQIFYRNADGTAGASAPVYEAALGTDVTTLTQPLSANTQGRFPGWLDPGDYVVRVTSLGITRDQAYSIPPPGPTGPTGPTGATGPPGIDANWRGLWASGTTYSAGPPPDGALGSNGHWYVSLSSGNIGHDPTTDGGVHWADQLPPSVVTDTSGSPKDIDSTGVTGGQVLAYDNASGKFKPTANGGSAGILGAILVPVDSLQANPRAVTDWGPILNTQIALGPNQRLVFGPFAYPFTTPIDVRNTVGICFEGPSGNMWPGDAWATTKNACALIYKSSGATGAILYGGSNAFKIRDMGVYYDNTAGNFTGRLLDPVGGNPTARARFSRAELGSLTLTTAGVVVSLDNVISSTVEDCAISGATWGIKGRETTYSNANEIKGNTIVNCTRAHIGNIWSDWTIGPHNTFEVPVAVIDDDYASDVGSTYDFFDNGVWDVSVTTPLFKHSVHNYADAHYHHNRIFANEGPVFQFVGGRIVEIRSNRVDTVINSSIVDLGDTGAGALAKEVVQIDANVWTVTGMDGVIHRAGHGTAGLFIGANGMSARTKGEFSLTGHESVSYPTDYTTPAVTALSLGGAGASVAAGGTDLAFRVIGTAGAGGSGSGGSIIRCTFGTLPAAIPGTPGAMPNVQITPQLYTAGVSALPYVSNYDGTMFEIGVINAIPAGQSFAFLCRVTFQ